MNILFLGDSITDCDHCFSSDNLGHGYVKEISKLYKSYLPELPVHITNGGTDGFTFPRILQKWKQTYTDQSWDIVCVLAGINEAGYLMGLPASEESSILSYIQRSSESFSELLSSLILHKVKKIIILSPFLFEQPAYLISWIPVLQTIQNMIHEICQDFIKHHSSVLSVYSLQDYWNQLTFSISSEILSPDGIHLSDIGHQKLGKYIFQLISGTVLT